MQQFTLNTLHFITLRKPDPNPAADLNPNFNAVYYCVSYWVVFLSSDLNIITVCIQHCRMHTIQHSHSELDMICACSSQSKSSFDDKGHYINIYQDPSCVIMNNIIHDIVINYLFHTFAMGDHAYRYREGEAVLGWKQSEDAPHMPCFTHPKCNDKQLHRYL